jgi:hypothetical protein
MIFAWEFFRMLIPPMCFTNAWTESVVGWSVSPLPTSAVAAAGSVLNTGERRRIFGLSIDPPANTTMSAATTVSHVLREELKIPRLDKARKSAAIGHRLLREANAALKFMQLFE